MTRDWFLDRIGKKIYRNNTYCCEHCYKVYKEGLLLADEMHANYVYDCYSEDRYLMYFDTRAEALSYERKHFIRLQWERFKSWCRMKGINYREWRVGFKKRNKLNIFN